MPKRFDIWASLDLAMVIDTPSCILDFFNVEPGNARLMRSHPAASSLHTCSMRGTVVPLTASSKKGAIRLLLYIHCRETCYFIFIMPTVAQFDG